MTNWSAVRSNSLVASVIDSHRERLQTAATHSWLLARLDAGQRTLGRAAAHSRVGGAGRTMGRWVRESWLYGWLTKEPDPDIVVIDLRETWTVGPLLAGLDWLVRKTQRGIQRSGLDRLGDGVERTLRTAPVQILGIVAFVAVLVNTLATTVLGSLTDGGLGLRLLVLAIATLATRVDATWDELRDGRVGWLVRAVFVPPELPDEADDEPEAVTESNRTDRPKPEPGPGKQDPAPKPSDGDEPKIEDVATLDDGDDA